MTRRGWEPASHSLVPKKNDGGAVWLPSGEKSKSRLAGSRWRALNVGNFRHEAGLLRGQAVVEEPPAPPFSKSWED